MRIGGLASGMDIDGLVEKLMQAEKAPLNKLYQNKQTYEWQRDAYRDVNKQLKAFDSFLFDKMTLQKGFYEKNVTTSNPAVSATASSTAPGSLNINRVDQVATSGTAVGNISSKPATTTKLEDLGVSGDVNGKINIKLRVLQKDGKMADIEKTFDKSDSLQSVIDSLNKDTGINAFYDQATGQFSIAAQATGAGESFDEMTYDPLFGGDVPIANHEKVSARVVEGGELFTALGFEKNGILAHNGQDAKLTINGAEITRSSNTFEVNGYTVTLNEEYTGTKPITLTANTDADMMVDNIKKFVETYNGLVESLSSLTKQTKYRDYKPLTDEQKKDMSEKDIEKWEEKAKSGILRNDQVVRDALDRMRAVLYEKGGSSNPLIDTLHEMGITTTKDYTDGGKLEINETKLRAKIAEDPEAVYKTFANTTEGSLGIAKKLRNAISVTEKKIDERAGKATATDQTFTIGKNLVNVNKRIDTWELKLKSIEDRYWSQFTAMEKAINKANEQSSLFATNSGQ